MKRFVYIAAFTVLGILVQFMLHAILEIWYLKYLLADFPKFGFGLSWQQWFIIHHFSAIILFFAGLLFGFWQGMYWWEQIYVRHRYGKKSS